MNFSNIGNVIGKIVKRNDKKKESIADISIAPLDKQKKMECFDNIELPDDEIMQHMPYQDKKGGNNRQVLYINGASGSGKSYYTGMYVREYVKMFPKNKVYIFSSVTEDKNLDKIDKKRVHRVKLNDKFVNTPLTIEDFKDSLVLYDDTECITNEALAEKLSRLKALIMTTGRHKNVFYVETSHLPGGHRNRLLLAECNSITLFLGNMGSKSASRFLEVAFGFDTKQIRMIRHIESRWVTIFRTQPLTVMHENGIMSMGID